jgi:hypothetical protein
VRNWTLPGDSGLKLGPRGDKALYDPYAGIIVITPGGQQTFRRLKDIYPAAYHFFTFGVISSTRTLSPISLGQRLCLVLGGQHRAPMRLFEHAYDVGCRRRHLRRSFPFDGCGAKDFGIERECAGSPP